jgi:hypothetical protein
MNFDSFSHGQMKSKLWLAEKLEPYQLGNNIVILGSWYNLTALILKTRNYPGKIVGIDIDPDVKSIADKVCNMWVIEGSVENITGDANNITVPYDTIINCSSEHMTTEWFDGIKPGTLVCIQSSNVTDPEYPWLIKTASPDIESFKQKYNLSTTLFCDTLTIQYGGWGYDRYMLIGIK